MITVIINKSECVFLINSALFPLVFALRALRFIPNEKIVTHIRRKRFNILQRQVY